MLKMLPGIKSKPKTSNRNALYMCFCALLLLWIFSLINAPSTLTRTNATSDQVKQIVPGSSIESEINGDAKQSFEVKLGHNQLLKFSINKGDLVLSATISGPTGTKLIDYLSGEFEVVEISYPADVAGTYRIQVESHENPDNRRKYELKLEPPATVTARDRRDSEARQALGRAERLRANWLAASLNKALEEYDKAAQIWISIDDFLNASRAMLKSSAVRSALSKYPEALKQSQSAAMLAQKAIDAIAESRALSQVGLVYSQLGNNSQAQKELTKARQLAESVGNQSALARNAQGEALSNLAEVIYSKGYLSKSSRLLDEARKLLQDDRGKLAKVHLYAGYIAGTLGDGDKADAEMSKARELYRIANDRLGEGRALALWGTSYSYRNNQNDAIKAHRAALEIFQAIGDHHGEAISTNGLGQAYQQLNAHDVAISHYEKALRIAHNINSPDLGAGATISLGMIYFQLGQLDKALDYNRRCLELSRRAGNARFEAHALRQIATIYVQQGRHELALEQFEDNQRFFAGSNDRIGLALTLNAQGDVLSQINQKPRALDAYNRALPLSETIRDQDILLATLYSLARTHFDLGNHDAALSHIKRSLEIIENLRRNIGSPELRVSYFSGVKKHYDLCVEILMKMDEVRPRKGYAVEALSVNNQSRARSLVDLLSHARADLLSGAPVELVNRERELRALIRLQAQYEMDVMRNSDEAAEAAEVANDMAQLRSEYQEVQLKLRERYPQLRMPAPLPLLSLAEVQAELGNGDTMLLQYFLGKEKSYLWAITHNSFQSYPLPPAKTIEDAAVELYRLTTVRQETAIPGNDYQKKVAESDKLYFEKASQLSNTLLGPVAEQLGERRLIIIADGTLQYTQFEALPFPFLKIDGAIESQNPAEVFLIGKHEIVGLPSISTLKAIRAGKSAVQSPDKLVAVIADPVFSANDERVQINSPSPVTVRAALKENPETSINLRGNGPARLPYSSAEADAIASAAPSGATMVAKGFDANRQTAMSVEVGQYQIVHFATHGFFDSENPELSSIVLSMVDRNGAPQVGVMPLHDIHSLNLSAQVTVLSACQTALGKDIKGEGLVGLTQSFMSAGSKSVVASLWKVDDRATAILMPDFYKSMLQQERTPAAALRSAKLNMMQDKQLRAPYYWAGFVLQGEYTNHINVDRNTSFRSPLVILLVLVSAATGLFLLRRRLRA